MTTIEETTSMFKDVIEAADAPLENSVMFDLGEAGVIRIDGREVSNERIPADLVLSTSADDFRALGAGQLDPMVAMVTGRLRLSNMVLAMRMRGPMLEMFKAARGNPRS